jgi:hypothetical protein
VTDAHNPRSLVLPGGRCPSPLLVGRLAAGVRLLDRASSTGACPPRRRRRSPRAHRPGSCPLERASWSPQRDVLPDGTACATASQHRPHALRAPPGGLLSNSR